MLHIPDIISVHADALSVHAATTVDISVEMERNAAMRLETGCRVKKFCKLQPLSHNHKQPVRSTPKTHGERFI